jgi:polyhydroxyalkanoate synthesis regulator phasin
MSEQSTHETPDARSFEERVFARFDALDARMNALEEKVDRRLQETRPVWEAVQAQLERLNSKVDILITDFYEVRTDIARLDKRVSSLEGQRTQ